LGLLKVQLSTASLAIGTALLLAVLSFVLLGTSDTGDTRPALSEDAAADFGLTDQGAAATREPTPGSCPAQISDLRIVDPAELSRRLVPAGQVIESNGCPVLAANRDDRTLVLVPNGARITISGRDLDLASSSKGGGLLQLRELQVSISASTSTDYIGAGHLVVLQAGISGNVHPIAVDSQGNLWLDPSPLSSQSVIDVWTGNRLDTSKATELGAISIAGGQSTQCGLATCEVLIWGTTSLAGLMAPIEGIVGCSQSVDWKGRKVQVLELGTPGFTLSFVEQFVSIYSDSSFHTPCEGRPALAGDQIGSHPDYRISAKGPDGQPLRVGISVEGNLVVGLTEGKRLECPCTIGR
jgi:hypothetical protein